MLHGKCLACFQKMVTPDLVYISRVVTRDSRSMPSLVKHLTTEYKRKMAMLTISLLANCAVL